MLTQEQWDALTPEEQAARVEEKPSGTNDGGGSSEVEKLTNSVKELTEKVENLQREKSGIYGDYKEQKEANKQLKAKVDELEEKLSSGGEGDSDLYLTVNKAKTMLANSEKKIDEAKTELRGEFAAERERVDERRMKERKDLPIPYEEAIKVWAKMAKDDPSLYRQVKDEGMKPGGRPAELAYKIAIREHPEFVKRIKESTREEVVKNLNKTGAKRLPGGAAGGQRDYNDMSIEDLMKLDDKTLDALARGEKP